MTGERGKEETNGAQFVGMDGFHMGASFGTEGSYSGDKKGKRRKVIKSCTFCRKRKLKCSQARPMCQQCVIRKLPQCIYTEEFNYPVTNTVLFSQVPNVALVQKIQSLQNLLTENNNDTGDESMPNGSLDNPLRFLRTSVLGENGSMYVFGPTSWKTLSLFEPNKFQTEFQSLWAVLKPPPEYNEPLLQESSIVSVLPTFSQLKICVDSFFSSSLFDLLRIFNKDDVLPFLEKLFVRDATNVDLIVLLNLTEDPRDKYNLGIILQILCLKYYNQNVPSSIKDFIHGLTVASSSSSLNFIERLQFFLLSYINIMINCTSGVWDGTQGIGLVNELCQSCLSLGLDDINRWHMDESQETKESLRCIWFWTLFFDVSCSYDVGKPPFISDDSLNLNAFTVQDSESSGINSRFKAKRSKLMHDFLRVSRFISREIHKRQTSEKTPALLLLLTRFVQSNFSPIEHYTNPIYYSEIDPFAIMILSRALCMITSIGNIDMVIRQNHKIIDKNKMVQFTLISISICVNTILFNFEKSANEEEDILFEGLKLSTILINPLLIRIVSEVYGLAFHKLTFRERGFLFLIDLDTGKRIQFIKYEEEDFDEILKGFDVRSDKFLTFSGTIIRFYEIIDTLFDSSNRNKEIFRAVSKSYQLTSTLAFERVSRVLFDKATQARLNTEKVWLKKGINMEQFSDLMIEEFINDVWKAFKHISQDLWCINKKEFYKQYNFDI
ncbi:hypothetical protein SEUBUCD646_0L03190 [Saccharomyces eubayanus]|uniref:Transcription factor n=2 Tax=Saccharomyces TaxID=4930 RepID=A0A6C1EDC8_SACPS|nr:transcription factor [Saccharomyces pastorianus]CAI1592039.1 hypothetical protein SEUBUCD650_0L03180 [Saccharomyces eubayanus]CAI1617801.1 hypothetical protein SEUBUCD646_0L03190 [Saccharomyces eubayanus]